MTALKYWDGTQWKTIGTVQGPQGPAGANGAAGAPGAPGQGVPAGGATGHVLNKKTAADYDTQWSAPTGGAGLPEVFIGDNQPTRQAELLWMDTDEAAPLSLNIAMDTWHYVGQAGEPTFQNGWSNYGGGFSSAGFRKYPDGRVRLRGMIGGGTVSGSATGTGFTLPVGYRPPATLLFDVQSGSALGRVDIDPTGAVRLYSGVSGWFSLDNIEFDTDTVLQTASVAAQPLDSWHIVGAAGEPAFQNSWVNFGAPYGSMRFRKYPDGRVRIAGCCKTGATGTVAFTLPVGYRPASSLIIVIDAYNGTGYLIIGTDGTVSVYQNPGGAAVASGAYCDGVEFDTETVSSYASGFLGPPKVTVLPANPVDGQECYFVASAARGMLWHLRYDALSGSDYKWEFLGGSELRNEVDTLDSTTSTTYVNMGSVGPQLTVPLAGDYFVEVGAFIYSYASGVYSMWMSYSIGAAAATDSDGANAVATVQFSGASVISQRRQTGLAAGNALVAKYRVDPAAGATARYQYRWMHLKPIRVG